MSKYVYSGEPEERSIGPLADGDYDFVVTQCGEPYESKAGNLVLSVELEIQGSRKVTVFYNPWVGVDKNGEKRDGVADFLHAINRVPKIGEEPRWDKLAGARGRLRLTTEIAGAGKYQGQSINKVHYLYRPRVAAGSETNTVTTYSSDEVKQAREDVARRAGAEPTDIPFKTTIYRDVKAQRLSRRFVQ
jgi:hypothetical protein